MDKKRSVDVNRPLMKKRFARDGVAKRVQMRRQRAQSGKNKLRRLRKAAAKQWTQEK